MDIMQLATQVLASKLGNSANTNDALLQSVIGNLLGGSNNQGIDLGAIVGSLQGGGLADIAESWLSDGDNADIAPSQIEALLGSDKLRQAAAQLGANQDDLLEGLRALLPQVVDNSSRGGSLLDSVGGLAGLAGLAGKFLNR